MRGSAATAAGGLGREGGAGKGGADGRQVDTL